MLYQKNIELKYDVDVFVAGGGMAGVAAAVAAARSGKKVFLAESLGAFGGLGTSGMVPAFATFGDGVNILSSGIGLEIRENVMKDIPVNTYWTPINYEELKRELDRIVKDAGVEFSFFTTLYDVITDGDKIERVILGSKSGLFALKAKIYIDCTGDGDLCAFGGGKYEFGDEDGNVMPQTLCSIWADVNKRRTVANQNQCIEEAYNDGILSVKDRHLPGIFRSRNGMGGGNIGHTYDVNPIDETSLTDAMIKARKLMPEYENYYKEYLKGYENMSLFATAAILGVRESRRIVCDYMLCVDDFIKRSVFEDEIGRYCYPVDIHVKGTDEKAYEDFLKEYKKTFRYKKGESYGIPYRSLIPVSFKNALVAGRCMGTDRKMQASVRVMPGCFITGQAAGCAASLACETGDVRKISVKQLQKNLIDQGAYLPNFKE